MSIEYLFLTLSVFPMKVEEDSDLEWGEYLKLSWVENNLTENSGKSLKSDPGRWERQLHIDGVKAFKEW